MSNSNPLFPNLRRWMQGQRAAPRGHGGRAPTAARGHLWLPATAITLLLGGSVGGTAWLIATRPTPGETERLAPGLRVRAVRVHPTRITETLNAYGTVQAERYAWISAEVAGQVVEVADVLKPGARVEAGQSLLEIDSREYNQQLQRARGLLSTERARGEQLDVRDVSLERMTRISETELEIATRELDRVSELFTQGASNQRELDVKRLAREDALGRLTELENEKALLPKLREEAHGAVALRQAEVALAELNLERTQIRAPFSARIDEVLIEAGEQVAPGQRVLALLNSDRVEIPLRLPVSRRDSIRVGAQCYLHLESRPQAAWNGTISRVSPSAVQATRTFTVFVEVDNRTQDAALVPGMLVLAQIESVCHENAIVIPRHCLRDGRVFVQDESLARSRSVHIVAAMREQVVAEGLHPGQAVITSNLESLHDGMRIEITGFDDLEMAGAALPGA